MTLLSAATPIYLIKRKANVSHTLATEYGRTTLANMEEQTNAGESLPEEREDTKTKPKNRLTTPPADILESLRTHYQSGQLAEAASLAARLSQTFPLHPFAWKVLGAVAYDEGRIADAVSLHNTVIELAPSDAEAYFNMGIMLKALGEPEGALANYRKAVSLKPEYPEAINNIGSILLDLNQLADAEKSLQLAITIQPNNCRAHNNLGLVLAKRQQFDRAVHCYKTAILLDADFSDAVTNLGLTLTELGRLDEAIVVLARAVELQPANEMAYINLGSALAKVRFTSSQPALYETISNLLTQGNFVRPAEVSEAVASLLRHDPIVQDFLFNQKHLSDPEILLQKIENLSQISLLHHFMRAHPFPDIEIESALTALRSAVLRNIKELASETSIENFLSSLALHCFVNEYIYWESNEEALLILALERKLRNAASEGQRLGLNELLCLATYRSLFSLEWLSTADIEQLPCDIRVRLIDEPAMEHNIAGSIPLLTTIHRKTSLRVKQQYEENPYPRWTSVPESAQRATAKEIFDTMGINFEEEGFQNTRSLQVLVAGCGTGQQAIEAAFRYKDAHITGIDLSVASLAYAFRKTQELGIENISYLNADILDVDQLGTHFDIIECSGVLHHMHDPMSGWRALTNQLRAGGLMRIALYSELAREHIAKVREEIETLKIKPSPSGIRNFRQALISSTAPHHAKLKEFLDFYSLSELRDLIFHVQEHRFNALEVQESLSELGLCFLGFEDKNIRSKLRDYKGDNSDHRDLAAWHDLETNAPDTFRGMYQFWCQKG